MENVKGAGSRSVLNKIVSHGSAILLTGMRHLIGQKSVSRISVVYVYYSFC